MPSNPPAGWAALQEKAKQAKDPRELAEIIAEMNRLLAEYEKTAGEAPSGSKVPVRRRKSSPQKRS